MPIGGNLCFVATALVAPLLLALRWIGTVGTVRRAETPDLKVKIETRAGAVRHPPRPPGRPCPAGSIYGDLPHCDRDLSKEDRLEHLIGRLTPAEKISLLGHDSPSIDRPGMYLPAYKWWNEGLHGMAWTDCCPPHRWENVTVFPQVIGLGMAWNRTLWGEVGGAISDEAVRKVDDTMGSGGVHPGLTYWTPNINIFRDPRWGRGQETPGEDPYLTSHYAAIMVMALQYGSGYVKQFLEGNAGAGAADGSDGRPLRPRIVATCKHFAAYSLETNRLSFSAEIHDERDWNDTYLPAFEACIHAGQFLRDHFGPIERPAPIGGAIGVMCSYNAINEVPSCASPALLREKLRGEWGFRGYVVSDCWAVANMHKEHHYAKSYEEAVGAALRSGVDLDCGDTVQGYGMRALERGLVEMGDVDGALTNLFGVLFDVGYFDDRASEGGDGARTNHGELAFEAALQSIVLLKNGRGGAAPPLPLSVAKYRKLHLVGPLADDKKIMLGNYHGVPSDVITPAQGLRGLGVDVEYVRGCDVAGGVWDDTLCQQMGADGDFTILVMGLDQSIESEGRDRTSLLLPKVQRDVIEEATRCSKERDPRAPVILVVMTGGPVDLSSYKANDDIDAVLYTGYPGEAGGEALAHIIYGRHNPSGRLATTMYRDSFIDEVALEDMRMRPGLSDGGAGSYPGRTYRFYDGATVYPFGHGLSYSSWGYSIRQAARNIEVDISNNGPMDGSDSVLLFHSGPDAGKDGNPIRSLVGFEKVFVPAGGGRRVMFDVGRWMAAQGAGTHLFSVGPSTDHTLRVDVGEMAG